MARCAAARPGEVWQGEEKDIWPRRGIAWHSMVRPGLVRYGKARHGLNIAKARYGAVWRGRVRLGKAWQGEASARYKKGYLDKKWEGKVKGG